MASRYKFNHQHRKFDTMKAAPDEIHNVSQTQLSTARHYGGCILNGKEYVYFPDEDKLVRKDLLKKKKAKKEDNNGKLF